MNRISFGVGSVWALGAGALLALACNGKISTGSNTPQFATVTSAEVSGPVTACQVGYAHPNVCCQAGAAQASTCGDYPTAPFHACDLNDGWTTYPDPRSCCPLDGNGACVVPPPQSTPPTSGVCANACPPGTFEGPGGGTISVGTAGGSGSGTYVGPNMTYPGSGSGSSYTGSGSGTFVGSGSGSGYTGSGSGTDIGSGSGSGYTGSGTGSYYGSGSGSYYGSGSGTGPVVYYGGTTCCTSDGTSMSCEVLGPPPSGCACACPANGPCPPCNCPAEPVPVPPLTGCGACPAAWAAPIGPGGVPQPDLCCQQDPNTGDIDCFSQAVSPPGVAGGSGSGSGSSTVGFTDAGCFPLPCPSNAQWNPATCSCGG